LKPGTQIVIPNGVIAPSPNTPSASFLAGSGSYIVNSAFRPSHGGNGYDYGWCTWHAANRRAAAGRPIPSNWGNAIGWKYNAAASGYGIGSAPQPGAVVYHNNMGGWGHVAYVERVTADGAWFSDMNYPIWGGVTERFVPASEYGSYSFIY
jgi:surface antigen